MLRRRKLCYPERIESRLCFAATLTMATVEACSAIESAEGEPGEEFALSEERAWHNKAEPHDVNKDGAVSPIDALRVINYLISEGAGELPAERTSESYIDTTGDNYVSPRDALLVINRLNKPPQAQQHEPQPPCRYDELSGETLCILASHQGE